MWRPRPDAEVTSLRLGENFENEISENLLARKWDFSGEPEESTVKVWTEAIIRHERKNSHVGRGEKQIKSAERIGKIGQRKRAVVF